MPLARLATGLTILCRRRPALAAGSGFAIGACVAETTLAPIWSDAPPPWLPGLACAAALLAAGAACSLFVAGLRPAAARCVRRPGLVALIALLLGISAASGHAFSLLHHPLRQRALAGPGDGGGGGSLIARIGGVGTCGGEFWQFPVIVLSVDGRNIRGRVTAVADAALLEGAPPLPGDVVRITGQFYLPAQQMNPYEYDARRGLARDNVAAKLRVTRMARPDPDAPYLALGTLAALPLRIAGWCAYRLQRLFDCHLAGDARALASAFLLGNREPMREGDLRLAFEASGGLHLAAVSGLHVGLVLAGLDALCRALRVGRRRRNLVALATAALYSIVAGGSASVLRATIMVGCVRLAPRGRRPDSLNTLALAAGALVLANPLLAGEVGFQLSLLATLGIIAAGRAGASDRSPDGGQVRRWARAGLLASSLAQLATLPVTAHCFSRVTPAAPATNLLLLPAGAVAITVTFAAGCAGLVCPPAFAVIAPVLSLVLRSLAWTVRLLARISGGALISGDPGPIVCPIAAASVLLCLAGFWRPRRSPALALVPLVLLLGCPALIHRPPAHLEIRFAAIGQGDCALLRIGDLALLVDCGAPGLTDAPDSSAFSRFALPFLRATRTEPDVILISHPHADHCGGLADALRLYPQAIVLTRERFLGDVIREAGLDPRSAERVRAVTEGGAVYLPAHGHGAGQVWLELVPLCAERLAPGIAGDQNEESLVLRVRAVERSPSGTPVRASAAVLLTGDIGAAAETSLLREQRAVLPALVLKVAHHGSNGSSTEPFLQAVCPALSVISVGVNRFGHPGAGASARLAAACPAVLRTDRQGMITVTLPLDGVPRYSSFR